MSDERFYLGNNGTTICDRNRGGSDGFNMLTKFEVVDLLNEQQEQLDVYKEAILTMLGLLADKGIIFSGVKDE